uniref:SERTA domain-containing protein n=1 Tax=Pelusios castaneus TaxID=367368 RepID=A0A8C8VE82_9SAUR
MLGRGLKRKLSDYEENMAGLSSAFDSSRSLPYPLRRQLVLNMCLTKLQTYKMLVEPNLHRSVLIANTVRQIQEEMRYETSQQPVNVCNGIAPNPHSYPGIDSSGISSHMPSGSNHPPTCLVPTGDEPELKGAECVFGSFEISNSTSYLKDLAIDDIFEDIDTSMYDSDFCSLMAARPPAAATEETLKTFPSCNSSSANNIQICRTDLSELDHIMEILVGS